jgi:hypothetical protein
VKRILSAAKASKFGVGIFDPRQVFAQPLFPLRQQKQPQLQTLSK